MKKRPSRQAGESAGPGDRPGGSHTDVFQRPRQRLGCFIRGDDDTKRRGVPEKRSSALEGPLPLAVRELDGKGERRSLREKQLRNPSL